MMQRRRVRSWAALAGWALAASGALSAQAQDKHPGTVSAKDSPEAAIQKFSVAPGLTVEPWAAEPLLVNPVAFSFDDQGRAFVVETHRRRSSTPDIRKNEPWITQSLALRTVDDRINFLKDVLGPARKLKPADGRPDLNGDGRFDFTDWEIESERIRLVEDSDGDGKADRSRIFAEGFNELATGVAAGVLARGDEVWFTCVPHLWRLRGAKTGEVTREKVHTGFGVHVAYSGHDMHGLRMGPDGKIYWSIADCGAHVPLPDGKALASPDSGAVFRCDPDGSNAEIVAIGLRNPQHLAFNDVGDLFTGDNNADGGDRARWLHVVEDADYGWRLGWQFARKPRQLGLWNAEGMWHLDAGLTNPAILPAAGHVGHGPAGIAWYPGTGLPEQYRGHFFMADFPGGVRAFAVTPKGASYTVENPKDVLMDNSPREMTGKLLWGLYPSDVQFGVDGGVYVLDWIFGWEKTGKGRIYRVHDPAVSASPLVQQTKQLLRDGLDGRVPRVLAQLLGHPDQRVRMAAQFELVAQDRVPELTAIAEQSLLERARLHAIWGLGMLGRRQPELAAGIMRLLGDATPEVRAQAAKVLGDLRPPEGAAPLIERLSDPSPRVRFFAARALGRMGAADAVKPLIDLIARDAAADAFLRHAAVTALARCAEDRALAELAGDAREEVRLAAVLALRKRGSVEVARFLADESARVVLEAARAIHDQPITPAMPALATLTTRRGLSEPILRRAINANWHLGDEESADRLVDLALAAETPDAMRLDALDAIGNWEDATQIDRLLSIFRARKAQPNSAAHVLAAAIPRFVAEDGKPVAVAAATSAGALKATEAGPALATAFQTAKDENLRVASLYALADMKFPTLDKLLEKASEDPSAKVRELGRRVSVNLRPENAAPQLGAILDRGSLEEQQNALATLAVLDGEAADKLVAKWLFKMHQGKVPAALHLDVLEAGAARSDANIQAMVVQWEKARKANDAIAKWRECLEGGNAKAGERIFAEHAEAACMRCHKVKGTGGDVGPDLAGIAARMSREELVRAIVDPNATIAKGYENVLVTMKDERVEVGLLAEETADELVLKSLVDGTPQRLKKSEIKERAAAPSAMPPGLGDVLGKRDLRDVVEYLATLK